MFWWSTMQELRAGESSVYLPSGSSEEGTERIESEGHLRNSRWPTTAEAAFTEANSPIPANYPIDARK